MLSKLKETKMDFQNLFITEREKEKAQSQGSIRQIWFVIGCGTSGLGTLKFSCFVFTFSVGFDENSF